MNFPSTLVEQAVDELSKLPSIGKKTALRLVLHILKQDETYTKSLADALISLRTGIQYCSECHSISDGPMCGVCLNTSRDSAVLCVVEDTRDVLAIENTNQYFGKYHVLGGIISPIDGVGPQDINLETLFKRVAQDDIKEVILALSSTMEGETTSFYISKKLKEYQVTVSSIARGVPIGGELEYADELTLGRSIVGRTVYASF